MCLETRKRESWLSECELVTPRSFLTEGLMPVSVKVMYSEQRKPVHKEKLRSKRGGWGNLDPASGAGSTYWENKVLPTGPGRIKRRRVYWAGLWGLGEKGRLLGGVGQTEPLQRCRPKQTEKERSGPLPHTSLLSALQTPRHQLAKEPKMLSGVRGMSGDGLGSKMADEED